MNKNEALAAIIDHFSGDTDATAEWLSAAYDEEILPEISTELTVLTSELQDETELHEFLKTFPRTKIGNLAAAFADFAELCNEHSSDPEVCGCDI